MMDADLGKIIGLIMENPTLLQEIKRLAQSEEDIADAPPAIEAAAAPEENRIEPSTAQKSRNGNEKRRELLRALSPYISEPRRKAVETFMTIADILELMRAK